MPSRAKPLPADERRAVTVEAVVQLAAEQNPNDITTASIATRMGLTHGALFRHFPTKDAILQAVMEWVAERLLSRVNQAAESTTSPVAALEALFMTHVDFVVEHPGVPRIMFGELQRAEESGAKRLARTLVQKYGQRLQKLVEAGKAKGELNIALDSEAAAKGQPLAVGAEGGGVYGAAPQLEEAGHLGNVVGGDGVGGGNGDDGNGRFRR